MQPDQRHVQAAALIATIACAGCGRVNFDPLFALADASPTDAAVCAFGAPVNDPTINSPQREWAPAESGDGLTLYFSSNRSGNEELYRATRNTLASPWNAPVAIAELANPGDEEENPSPSADELELYWGGSQIQRAIRATRADPFGAATVVITDTFDFTSPQGPHISSDKLTLYFTANTATGADVFVVKRNDLAAIFDEELAVRVDELSTTANEGWPSLSPDERVVYFTSDKNGSLDLFTATRATPTDPFGPAEPIDAVNSPDADEDAGISADGATLWFASTRTGGKGDYDLWFAPRVCP